MGDITCAMLADSAIGFDIVADCLAVIDTVSGGWYCGRGVSCTYKNYSIFAGEDTGASREEVILIASVLPVRRRR